MRKRDKLEKKCKYCGNTIPNRNVYCDNVCQQKHQHTNWITEWLAGKQTGMSGKTLTSRHIRKWLEDRAGHKCEKCGWNEVNTTTGNIPIQINHINGKHTDNRPENLELICPNCHSLTETFGNINGRVSTRRGFR